ncbi:MAG TPA: SCO family protein, partial [Candidatus Berkiella sp.]|nr:SCO family protein [Candidatus Berkiella sp.]
MKKHTVFIIFIIGIALAIGIWRENHVSSTSGTQSLAPLSSGTALAGGHKLPEFSLIDMDGYPFTRNAFESRWSFVFFGYSSCPDLCPTTLQAMHQIAQRLRNSPMLQFVFITIDPEQDTQARLKDFL